MKKKRRCFWCVLVECAGFLPAKPVQLMCGLNSEGCLFYIISSPAVTFDTLHPVYLPASFWTGRGRRGDRVYRKVFGKWAVGFWSEGGAWATMVGGEGYLWICLRHLHPLFDTTGRRVSVRMCERGRHPQGWMLNPDFWRREQTFKLHIWRVEGSRKKESGFQSERERRRDREKSCKEQKDGCHETHAASPPADCAHANEDGEGRFNVGGILVRLSVWKRLARSCEEFSPSVVLLLFICCWMGGVHLYVF